MTIQEIFFELMERSSFNYFNGRETVKKLKEHQDLWKGVIWGRYQYRELIVLRDIADDSYNADTLFALVKADKVDEFIKLMQTLSPDEVDDVTDNKWVIDSYGSWSGGGVHEPGYRIIRVWWD